MYLRKRGRNEPYRHTLQSHKLQIHLTLFSFRIQFQNTTHHSITYILKVTRLKIYNKSNEIKPIVPIKSKKKRKQKKKVTQSRCFPLHFTRPNLEAVLEREVPVLVEGGHVCLHVSPYATRVSGVDLRHKGRTITPFKSCRR